MNTFWQEISTSEFNVFEVAAFMGEDPKSHFVTCKTHFFS